MCFICEILHTALATEFVTHLGRTCKTRSIPRRCAPRVGASSRRRDQIVAGHFQYSASGAKPRHPPDSMRKPDTRAA